MKYLNVLTIVIICSLVTFYACDNNDAARDAARDALQVTESPALPPSATPASPNTPEPAQNAAGVWHYTCSAGCEGGAGAAGSCAKCGGALAHNQAYHANNNAATTPPPANNTLTPPAPKTPEPAQNAAGVWHYTCSAGCAGGAGAAGDCSKCGGALAHNTAYHN